MRKYYSPDLVKRFQKTGRVESFFWHERASLPVRQGGRVQLMLWGNKDKDVKLPPTGWARTESLEAGKWDYLRPEEVDIPVDQGCEKKTWFDFHGGTKGVVVKRGQEERVYMITQEAGEEYKKQTGHGREPLGDKNNFEHENDKQRKLL